MKNQRPNAPVAGRARKKPGFSEKAGLLPLWPRRSHAVVMHDQIAVAAEDDLHLKPAAPAIQHTGASQQATSSFHLGSIGATGGDAHRHLDRALAATATGNHQHGLHRRRTGEGPLPQPAVVPILDPPLRGATASWRRTTTDFTLLDNIGRPFLDRFQRPFLPGIRRVANLRRHDLPTGLRIPMTRFRPAGTTSIAMAVTMTVARILVAILDISLLLGHKAHAFAGK